MTRARLCLLRLLALAPAIVLLAFSSSGPGNKSWQPIGPGGGGALFSPAVSPYDSNRVLVACDMTGSYLTSDGGQSWHAFNLRGRVRWFVFDPNEKNVVYARSIGLWRSLDGGYTWSLLYPNPEKVSAIEISDDHAAESLRTSEPLGQITTLAIDPANSKTLYAVLQRGLASSLVRSSDWGKTWSEVATAPETVQQIYIDPLSAVADRTLYVVTKNSVVVSGQRGRQSRSLPTGMGSITQLSMSFSEKALTTIYATDGSRIVVSEDGAGSWRNSELPGKGAHVIAVAAAPDHPGIAYVSYEGLKTGWLGIGRAQHGIARTSDAGKSWDLIWKESSECAENVHDVWIGRLFGCDYGGPALGISVAPKDPQTVYVTDEGRVLRTNDGGKTWESVYSVQHADGTFSSRGLETTTSYGVHFDPFDSKRMFVSYTDIGLFRSENGGLSWTTSMAGVPPAWRNTTYWMAFDPEVRGRVWAVMSKTHDLPRPKMWRRKSPSEYEGGVVRSDDGGRTWTMSSEGMAATAATHILVDPSSKAGARVLYVAAFGRGVYKSIDDGRTWQLKNRGLSEKEPLAWRLALAPDGDLYLLLARRSDDGTIGDQDDGAIYRSSDGAEHWTKLTLPSGVNGPNGLAIDPHDSTRLYLAAWGRDTPPQAQGGGIYLSTDSGKKWRNVLSRDQHVYDVTVDSRDPKILYAAGFESAVWRSSDHGKTWQRIPGFNFKWAHRVIPDPVDRDSIYVTTFGGGVWHGPARGDASAVDEIASHQVAHQK